MNNRFFYVKVGNEISSIGEYKAGVTQGSELGPIPFFIFIPDPQVELRDSMLAFADDTTIYVIGDNSDSTQRLTDKLNLLHTWMVQKQITSTHKKARTYMLNTKSPRMKAGIHESNNYSPNVGD